MRGGGSVQKTLLYLGEINDSQRAGWSKAIEAVVGGGTTQLCLFPSDREPPEGVAHVRIRMDRLELRRPRQWGACWLALELWDRLRLGTPRHRILTGRIGARTRRRLSEGDGQELRKKFVSWGTAAGKIGDGGLRAAFLYRLTLLPF